MRRLKISGSGREEEAEGRKTWHYSRGAEKLEKRKKQKGGEAGRAEKEAE